MPAKIPILLTTRVQYHGLYSLTIDGLRIGRVNAGTEALEDPMVTFLRTVLSAWPCAAHMSRDPWQDDQWETFSAAFGSERLVLTPVGVYCHVTIFRDGDRPWGVYLPHFTPDDLTARDEDGDLLITMLLILDQPLLYVNLAPADENRLRALFIDPPAYSGNFEIDWLHAATEIVPLVLVGGHDECCYHAFARTPEAFALLDEPLRATEHVIRTSPWFHENAPYLTWSNHPSERCLILPCGTHSQRHRCE